MIDTSLSFEETMERFLEDLPSRHKRDHRVPV
jgi:hypothetical protein